MNFSSTTLNNPVCSCMLFIPSFHQKTFKRCLREIKRWRASTQSSTVLSLVTTFTLVKLLVLMLLITSRRITVSISQLKEKKLPEIGTGLKTHPVEQSLLVEFTTFSEILYSIWSPTS